MPDDTATPASADLMAKHVCQGSRALIEAPEARQKAVVPPAARDGVVHPLRAHGHTFPAVHVPHLLTMSAVRGDLQCITCTCVATEHQIIEFQPRHDY